MTDNEVYTVTLEQVEETAEEFGRLVVIVPEKQTIIITDDLLVGKECLKEFEMTPYGLTLARRYAIRMDETDETSDEPFDVLRVDYLAEIGGE